MNGDPLPATERGPGLALVGYRGSGKSTVGRLLARTMNRRFVDIDVEIARRSGLSIASMFAELGEPAFRDCEEESLAAVLQESPDAIVATGGGSVLREQNRRRMRAFGRIVWLRADAHLLAQRLEADEKAQHGRPPLTPRGVIDEIAHVLHDRAPIYQEVADLVIDTGGKTPDEVAAAILRGIVTWSSS